MIQRDEHKDGYTVIANSVLTDTRLSFEARGFLAYLLSFPDDWNFTVRNLARSCGCSTDKIVRLSKELKETGYITQKQKNDSKGHFGAIEWEVSENCTVFENNRVRKTPNTAKVEHGDRVRETPRSDEPCAGSPEHGKVEHLLNTNNNQILNIQNTNKELNTKEKAAPFSAQLEPLSPEIRAVFEEFIKMRKKIRAPLTEKALELAIKKAFNLAQNDPEMVKAIVEQSIMKSWRGLFELKDDQGIKKAKGNEFIDMLREEAVGND